MDERLIARHADVKYGCAVQLGVKRRDTRADAYCIHDSITYPSKQLLSLRELKQDPSASNVLPSRTSLQLSFSLSD